MPTLVAVVGDKGGIGKSTWARGFADYLRSREMPTALFDGDWISRSLFKMFCSRETAGGVVPLARQDPRAGCMLYDVHHHELGRDIIINSVAVRGVDVVLHDLPAGFRPSFCQVMSIRRPDEAIAEFVRSMRELGVRVVFVTVVTPHWAGHQSAAWLAECVAGIAPVIAVRNHQFGDDTFDLWANGEGRRFVEAGGVESAMPGLDPHTYLNCDTYAVRYSAAGASELLAVADKVRVSSWRRRFDSAIDRIVPVFGLPRPGAEMAAPTVPDTATGPTTATAPAD